MATLLSPQPPQIKSYVFKYPLRRISVHSPPSVKFASSACPIFQLRTRPKHRSGKLAFCCFAAVTTVGQSDFESVVLKSDVPVLVEFVASWCGPCRLISPVIDWASQEYEGKLKIVKIDHDANPQLIEQYKVYGLPCLIFFKDGKQIPESRREGAITKAKLKQYIDNVLSSKTVL